MPGGPLPPPATSKASEYPEMPDLGKADRAHRSILRTSLVQCLRTAGWVVFVAAAGFIIYHLFASVAISGGVVAGSAAAPTISLLAHTSSGEIGVIGKPPKGDDRKYQHAVLPNGLQVVSVQDKQSLQTAFAMAVEAGSFDDPQSLPGLAHFCEHMLFLGTEQYPDASGFDNFMSANGGSNNAYTADEVTVYYAQVARAAGKEGLNRFADFFRAPLFDKQYVSKEVHAIDSEHAKNVQDPQRRILQVAMSLANPESPVGAFHTGDIETLFNAPKLKGIDPVEELKLYFKSNYCPPKMRLVTYSSESLATQLAQAKKDFGSIATSSECKKPRRSFARPEPWGLKRMGQFVTVRGSLPQAEMWLHFALPDLTKKYQSQPLNYIDHMLSYSGENSLVRVLQDNLGLVTSLQTMFDMNSAGTSIFVVMHLTKSGQDNLDHILDVFYAYLSKVHQKGVDEKLYDSLARVSKLQWDWAEPSNPSDTASSLAEKMIRLPPEHLLSGDDLIEKPNSSLVSSLIKALRPANMNLIYVSAASDKGNSSSFVKLSDDDLQTLPHYGVKYSKKTLSQELPGAAERWEKWIAGVAATDVAKSLPKNLVTSGVALPILPGPIEGVPTSIPLSHMRAAKVKGDADAAIFGARPKKVTQIASETSQFLQGSVKRHGTSVFGKGSEVWYRSGWATTSPKVQLQLTLRPAMVSGAPEVPAQEALRLGVFSRLLSEAMQPKMVDLTATGVGYTIEANTKGLMFSFSGFEPMMQKLVTKVLGEFNSFNGNASATQPSRFKRIIQDMRQGLRTYSDMPITYAIQDRNALLTPGAYSRVESLTALDKVTPESAASSVGDVLFSKPMWLTSLAMGNIAEQEAISAISTCTGGLHMPKRPDTDSNKNGQPERVSPVVRIVRPVEIRSQNPRAGDPNDAVVLSIVAGVATVRSRVVLGLLGQMLNAVAYNELRTVKQLGYVVHAGASQLSNVQYMSCIVQGNALKADAVEGSIEHVFTHLMPKRLKELTDKQFAAYKDALRQQLVQPPLNFQEEVNHFWGPVAQGGQCFELQNSMARYLDESLHSKDELISEWAGLANPIEGMRSKVVVKYFAGSVPPRPTEEEAAATWAKQGVADDSALALLRREYQRTTVYDHVDSKVREQLVKDGGYFPRELHCDLPQAGSPHFLKPTARHQTQ